MPWPSFLSRNDFCITVNKIVVRGYIDQRMDVCICPETGKLEQLGVWFLIHAQPQPDDRDTTTEFAKVS